MRAEITEVRVLAEGLQCEELGAVPEQPLISGRHMAGLAFDHAGWGSALALTMAITRSVLPSIGCSLLPPWGPYAVQASSKRSKGPFVALNAPELGRTLERALALGAYIGCDLPDSLR